MVIRDSFIKLIERLKKKPTYPEIAKDCGLSESTIQKHIEELEFDPMRHPLRMLSDNVLIAIYDSAIGGNVRAQKLWFQVLEGWNEKQEIRHSGYTPTLVELVKKYKEEKENGNH